MHSAPHLPDKQPLFENYRAETAYIHESSFVDSPCRVGEHTTILHFSHIMSHSVIGDFCFLGRNVCIASGVMVGNNVRVMDHAQLNSGVILENEVYCGNSVVFTEGRHIHAVPLNISRISPTLVRQGAQLGPHSVVASGSTIGRYSFIEAGTIVDRNIPDFAVVCGNPLKFVGWRCQCGQVLPSSPQGNETQEITCAVCGRQYIRQSRWKIIPFNQGEATRDSDTGSESSIRFAQGQD